MIQSRVTRRFWKLFSGLPVATQIEARRAYALFQSNPAHPSLHFKKLHGDDDLYSVRIGLGCRAIGVMKRDHIVWYWIGAHSEYDQLS